MHRFLAFFALMILATALSMAQGPYRLVSIHDIQYVPLDSLKKADTLNYTATNRWTLQTSPFYKTPAETVEVVGQVIVPPGIFTNQVKGFNMVLKDTAKGSEQFAYIFVRSNLDGGSPLDSVGLKNDGFMSVERGDIIRLRGFVSEFPTNQMTSATQFTPVPGLTITSIPGSALPPAIPKNVSDFFHGQAPANPPYPQNGIQFSAGEPYEGAYVVLSNLTVVATQGTTGTTYVRLIDSQGNMISTYDLSRWYTMRTSSSTYPGYVPRDPASTYQLPPIGATIDTIRGMITTVSNNQQHGYFIAPVFPGDLKIGITLPGIRTHRRTPVIVTTDDTVKITVQAFKQPAGNGIRSVRFWHQVNSNPWAVDSINGPHPSDSTYIFSVGKLSSDDVIRYFFQAVDSLGYASTYANAGTQTTSDTSKGFFFYQVFNRPLTIYDLQHTPYSIGASPYVAGKTMVTGIVTVDTSQLKFALNTQYTGPWYIAANNQPWNGLWINTAVGIHLLDSLQIGDSVTVRGTVFEDFDVTHLENVDSLVIHARGKQIPQAVVVTTGSLGTRANGDPEPEQYESMLVRLNNVTITDISPTGFSDLTEMEINDGTGRLIVRMAEGKHQYSNVPGDVSLGKSILYAGNTFSYIQGVLWYSFNKYKIVPRINSDFGLLTGIAESNSELPSAFALSQNYPNPFNPSTTIEFNVPTGGFVSLRVYNVLGQEVRTLVNDYRNAGHYGVRFDASRLPSGMYIYRLHSGTNTISKRLLLIK